MNIYTRTPEEAAEDLIEEGFPVEKYEEIQNHRKERLAFWTEHKQKALSDVETRLIEFGEKVLELLRKHYARSTDNTGNS